MTAVAKATLGRPSTFTRDDIVDSALALLARDGVDALTLRGLARELGCVLGTVGYHFDNLADLEDAVVARLLEKLPVLDATRSDSLREQLVKLGLAYIEVHSTHPYVRHIAGPISVGIAARQLRQHWATLQALGMPEHLAMLCVEMLSGLAHNSGTEIYRLRSGGEKAWQLFQEFSSKLGLVQPSTLSAASISAASLESLHREMLGNAIDIFLRGIEAGDQVKPRAAARRVR